MTPSVRSTHLLLWIIALSLIPSLAEAAVFTVNDLGDLPDLDRSDGLCRVFEQGQPVCTLRAAIEQANRTPALDTIDFDLDDLDTPQISPLSPLPAVTAPLRIDGLSHPDGIALEGASVEAIAPGLQLDAEVTLLGLTLRAFDGPGIVASAPLTLIGVVIADNCGWGVVAGQSLAVGVEGGVSAEQITTISNNGQLRRCRAGGILARDEVLGGNLELRANGGPGLLVEGDVDLLGLVSIGNAGAGLHAALGRVVLRAASRRAADNAIQFNEGAGIIAERPCAPMGEAPCFAVELVGVDLSDNGSWGVMSAGDVWIGALEGQDVAESNVSRNGFGERCPMWSIIDGEPVLGEQRCEGGGVLSPSASIQGARFVAGTNKGPGLMARGDLILADVTLQANEGEGGLSEGQILVTGRDARIAGNLGRGLVAGGALRVVGVVEVTDNGGWGIYAGGDVVLERSPEVSRRDNNDVSRNGLGRFCLSWAFVEGEPVGVEVDCLGGGIFTLGDALLDNLALKTNGGPGALARGGIAFTETAAIGNEGEGFRAVEGAIRGREGESAENLGRGVAADGQEDGVGVELIEFVVRDNFEIGVHARAGVVLGSPEVGGVSIDRNGEGDFCQRWGVEGEPRVQEVECVGGGVLAEGGYILNYGARISSNPGDGLRSTGAVEVPGQGAAIFSEDADITGNTGVAVGSEAGARIVGGLLCDNGGGPFGVAGAVALVGVEVCGDTDGDGVPNVAEDGVGGDLNGDGVPDSLQASVASFLLEGDDAVNVEVDAALSLAGAGLAEDPGGLPEDIVRLLPAHGFTIQGVEGQAEAWITWPAETAPSGIFVLVAGADGGEAWRSALDVDGVRFALDGDLAILTLEDQSAADRDGAPGALAVVLAPTKTLDEALEEEEVDGQEPERASPAGALCACQTPGAPPAPGWPLAAGLAVLGVALVRSGAQRPRNHAGRKGI